MPEQAIPIASILKQGRGERPMSMAVRLLLVAGSIALACRGFTVRPGNDQSASQAVFVQFGAPMPSTAVFRDNIHNLAGTPFQGSVVAVSGGDLVFRTRPNAPSNYDGDREALAATTERGSLTKDFIRVHGTAEIGWDWFSDDLWAIADQNLRQIANVAKQGGMKGILFDPEAYDVYGTSAWDYAVQAAPPGPATKKTFAQYQSQVRTRGRQFIAAYQETLPDAPIFFAGMLSLMQSLVYDKNGDPGSSVDSTALESHRYGLWLSFIEGMIEGADPATRLIDGNEPSYNYRRASEFDQARKLILEDALFLLDSSLREKYAAQVQVAQAVYLDGVLDLLQTSYFPYFGYFLGSDMERLQYLQHNAFHALRTSDGYVWIYGETTRKVGSWQVNWWQGTTSQEIVDALAEALSLHQKGQPLGFDFEPIVEAGEARQIYVSGSITLKGAPLNGATIEVTNNDVADPHTTECRYNYSTGMYICYFRKGWEGTLTPKAANHTFSPANLQCIPNQTCSSLQTTLTNQNFTAQ